jgi:hypothetical protein
VGEPRDQPRVGRGAARDGLIEDGLVDAGDPVLLRDGIVDAAPADVSPTTRIRPIPAVRYSTVCADTFAASLLTNPTNALPARVGHRVRSRRPMCSSPVVSSLSFTVSTITRTSALSRSATTEDRADGAQRRAACHRPRLAGLPGHRCAHLLPVDPLLHRHRMTGSCQVEPSTELCVTSSR